MRHAIEIVDTSRLFCREDPLSSAPSLGSHGRLKLEATVLIANLILASTSNSDVDRRRKPYATESEREGELSDMIHSFIRFRDISHQRKRFGEWYKMSLLIQITLSGHQSCRFFLLRRQHRSTFDLNGTERR